MVSPAGRAPLGPLASRSLVALAVAVAGLLLFWPDSTPAKAAPPRPVPSARATAPARAVSVAALASSDGSREPGLTLAIVGPAGESDRRSARSVALYVGEHDPATPFIASGPFTATWEGDLELAMWNNVTFSAEGAGSLQVSVGGKPVLDIGGPELSGVGGKVRLNKGRTHLVATYRSPPSGDASLRLMWSSSEFATEPVPPSVFGHAVDRPLEEASRLRRGRELVGTLLCTRCHAFAGAEAGMPELACDAPDLRDAGARFDRAWMAAWIADPQALRAGTTMPRVMRGDAAEIARQSADIAAWLAGLGAAADAPAGDAGAVARGAQRFAALGCVACHEAGSGGPARIDLGGVAAKWKPAALVEFLRHPAARHAWIAMPDFGLGDDEAHELASFLLAGAKRTVPAVAAGDPVRGAALAAATGCMNCHRLEGSSRLTAAPLGELAGRTTRGCLAGEAAARRFAPDFALAPGDLAALRAFISLDGGAGFASLSRRCLPEFAARRVAALDCAACHARDAAGGAAIPSLTGVGDKLRPEWMAEFIAGRCGYRTRPWLEQRMPAFATGVELLAQGLAMERGHPPTTSAAPATESVDPEIGRRLLGQEGGFACVACHAVGDKPAATASDAPGINLGYATQRLRKDWFHRWMRWPARVEPATKMPRFAAEDGTTQLGDVLGGRADDQFEAVWRCLEADGVPRR
jgi:mono/diheme cytochrome c family protein